MSLGTSSSLIWLRLYSLIQLFENKFSQLFFARAVLSLFWIFSFRIFRVVVYCLIIKVLYFVVVRDNFNRLSHLVQLVKNFFIFLFQQIAFVWNSLYRITCLSMFVNNFFILICCQWWATVLFRLVSRDSFYMLSRSVRNCQVYFSIFSKNHTKSEKQQTADISQCLPLFTILILTSSEYRC